MAVTAAKRPAGHSTSRSTKPSPSGRDDSEDAACSVTPGGAIFFEDTARTTGGVNDAVDVTVINHGSSPYASQTDFPGLA